MRNLLAFGFVLLVLTACGAHVYTNTHLRSDYGQWGDVRPPYWYDGGRSLPGLVR